MSNPAPLSVTIQAIDKFTAPLNRLSTRINAVTAPVRGLQTSFSALGKNAGVPQLADAWHGVTRAIGGVGDAAMTAVKRMGVLGAAGVGAAALFKTQFIDSADAFQRLGISLTAIEGNADKARTAMGFIRNIAIKSPFEMGDVAQAYRLMRNAQMDPTKSSGGLQAVIDQVAKMGGTSEQLTNVTNAITQMFGSQRINAQDMLQLVSANINGWQILERATERVGRKIPVAQLRKMSSEGKLGLQYINLLLEQMGRESAGAGEKMNATFGGMLSSLTDQWEFFKTKVMKIDDAGQVIPGGLMAKLQSRLQGILERVATMADSGELDKLADRVGEKLLKAFDWLEAKLPKVIEGLQGFGEWVAWLADQVGGFGNLLKLGLGAYIGGPLLVALAGLAASFVTLGAAIGFTPVGWILGGLAAIAAAGAFLITHWDAVADTWNDLWAGMKQTFGGILDTVLGVLTLDFPRALDGLGQAFAGFAKFLGALFRPILWAREQMTGQKTPAAIWDHSTASGGGPGGGTSLPSALSAGRERVTVEVKFTNLPRGASAEVQASRGVNWTLDRGVAMPGVR